jgi:phosphoribosylanthranilate isomerase
VVRVKICGITNVEDAQSSVDAGADALGFIFVAGTPRFVTPEAAARIIATLPPFVTPVGVFWDHAPGHVKAVADQCRLAALQFHGDEPPETLGGYDLPTIKAIKVKSPESLEALDRYPVSAILLDSPARWSEGEPRAPIAWELVRRVATRRPVILSAGLTPDTVRAAVRLAKPFAVDVNSGVEARPGKKDPEKLRRFVTEAKAIDGDPS